MTARGADRLVALVLALTVLSLVPSVLSALAAGGDGAPAPWTGAVLATYAALLVLLLSQVAHGRPRPWLPWALVAAGDLALLTWVLVQSGRLAQAPWVLALSPLTVGAGAVAAGLRAAMVLGLVHVGLRALVQADGAWAVPPSAFVLDALLVLVVVPVCWVAVAAVRSSGASVERARRRAEQEAVRESAAGAAELENARWDAIVHDDVLAALSTTAQAQDAASRAEARRAARTALVRVEGERPRAALPAERVWASLVREVRRLHPGAALAGPRGAHGAALDPDAAEALLSATAELVRNAVRHGAAPGDPPPPVRVRGWLTGVPGASGATVASGGSAGAGGGARLLVEVRDGGVGFVAHAPGTWRLGLAVSVRARVRAVGGEAHVRSWPGTGTCALLSVPLLGEPEPTGPTGPAGSAIAPTGSAPAAATAPGSAPEPAGRGAAGR
ncbi:hypothetical protein [Kineococcus gypseus]|uniref:hypothetical protein n=1 Tax=Kineococcus gypseus TaxID=1637102 RepID=UPI003D7E67BB